MFYMIDTVTKQTYYGDGVGGFGWNVTGNGSTTPAVNFLGTTDDVYLEFRVNNVLSGRIMNNSPWSTFLGYGAGLGNTSGDRNTAFGYQALIDGGYVKSSVTSLAQLDNPNSWTGKDGITDKSAWLSNGSVQESAMLTYTQTNYTRMISNGAITADMPPEEVGGMLSVAHLLGPNKGTPSRPGALGWRQGLGGADANGTTGDTYFQKGKFAVSVLAPQVAAVAAG
jgi:hypothetical protein